jgi:hypothetical protein
VVVKSPHRVPHSLLYPLHRFHMPFGFVFEHRENFTFILTDFLLYRIPTGIVSGLLSIWLVYPLMPFIIIQYGWKFDLLRNV